MLRGNQCRSELGWNALANTLLPSSYCWRLWKIDLSHQNGGDSPALDITPLAQALEINTSLKDLNLMYNDIAGHGMESLSLCLGRKNRTLQHLLYCRSYKGPITTDTGTTTTTTTTTRGSGISSNPCMESIASHLSGFLAVSSLDLSNNPLPKASLVALGNGLRSNGSLQHHRASLTSC